MFKCLHHNGENTCVYDGIIKQVSVGSVQNQNDVFVR